MFIFAAISSALSCVSSNTLSESRSNALCRQRTAAAACAPSTTTDSRMGDVEMARMLIWFSPSVENARAATPGDDFMPVPTRLTFAMSSSTS